METLAIVQELCGIPGVSGDEGAVRKAIRRLVDGHCEEMHTDALGNLLVYKKGRHTPKNKILLSAHMDEVGFVITYIEESGLLRFAAVGGIDSQVVVGKAVEVGSGRLPGIIGTKAMHMQEEKEREQVPGMDTLYIDIGATGKEEAMAAAPPGTRAVFHAPYWELGEGKIMARALDDRAGCAVLIALVRSELAYDCVFSFTVQEETGCVGAVTAGYAVKADIAVAVEATTASDIADVPPHKVVCSLGKGPVLSFMDKGTLYDTELFKLALHTAGENGIPCQRKEGVFGGNESRSLQVAGCGARVLAVSLPCRYLHSPSCVLEKSDIAHTVELLQKFVAAAGG